MIHIVNIAEMSKDIGENWMIVRAPDELLPYAKHVPELSPSPALFEEYRKVYLAGTFGEDFFDHVYVPRFLKDLSTSDKALALLNELTKNSPDKNYYLGCYCENERLCHRSIIAGILKGMGATIDTKDEYLKYYQMLMTLRQG